MRICHWLKCAHIAIMAVSTKLQDLWFQTYCPIAYRSSLRSLPHAHLLRITLNSSVFHHRDARPLYFRLPLPCPRPPCCPLDSAAFNPPSLFPRSAVEHRPRLSLANPICSAGIVTFNGSTSSCAGRGQAAKMQSIGCQSETEYFKSRFHLKLGLESQPFHFFDRSLAFEVGVNHCTSI
jgi:hypothetical protein